MNSHQGRFVPRSIERGHCPGCIKETDYPAYLEPSMWHGECWDEHLAKLGGYNPEGEDHG